MHNYTSWLCNQITKYLPSHIFGTWESGCSGHVLSLLLQWIVSFWWKTIKVGLHVTLYIILLAIATNYWATILRREEMKVLFIMLLSSYTGIRVEACRNELLSNHLRKWFWKFCHYIKSFSLASFAQLSCYLYLMLTW